MLHNFCIGLKCFNIKMLKMEKSDIHTCFLDMMVWNFFWKWILPLNSICERLYCIIWLSIIRVTYQITTNLVTWNNRNVCSHSVETPRCPEAAGPVVQGASSLAAFGDSRCASGWGLMSSTSAANFTWPFPLCLYISNILLFSLIGACVIGFRPL